MKIKRWDVSVLNSKKVIQKHNADFFTSDTDAQIQVKITDSEFEPTSATVVLYNQQDESLVEEEVGVINNTAKLALYNEERSLIEHSGGWLITVIFNSNGKKYTSREIGFYINSYVGEGTPERLEIVENWSKVKEEIDSMREAEIIRESNESDRVTLYNEVERKLSTGGFDGEPGPQGPAFEYTDFTEEQIEGLIGPEGPQGKAFEYVDFTPEQLEGLVGPQGIPGDDGAPGLDGDIGPEGPEGKAFEYVDFTPEQLEELTGPQGIPGEPGKVGPPGDKGEPGADGPAYQAGENITIDEDNVISAEGGIAEVPQATADVIGGIKAEPRSSTYVEEVKIDSATGKLFVESGLFAKSADWSYLLANTDLDSMDFTNYQPPGQFFRDNYIHGIEYNMGRMFAGSTFGTPPDGEPFLWGYDEPVDSFWRWYGDEMFWRNIQPSTMEYMFANTKGDTVLLPPDMRAHTPVSAEGMFEGSSATNITYLGWGTIPVSDTRNMFLSSTAENIDLEWLDTSNVTDMGLMFSFSSATTLDLSSLDTSNVTDMSNMFFFSSATTLDLSSFDTSNVTDMSSMFNQSSATVLDLSSFDTSNVTDMGLMFYGSSATVLDLSSFDTSNVTDMGLMFEGSSATVGYAKTQADADRFNASGGKPAGLTFVVK